MIVKPQRSGDSTVLHKAVAVARGTEGFGKSTLITLKMSQLFLGNVILYSYLYPVCTLQTVCAKVHIY